MKSLKKLVVKDFKILLRSKLTASLIIFGPLLLVILVGFALDSQGMQDIRIGLTNTSDQEILQKIENTFASTIIVYNDLSECKTDVNLGNLHSCVELPKEFKPGQQNRVNIHIDPSKMQLALVLGKNLETAVAQEGKFIGRDLTNELISVLNQFKSNLNTNLELIETISSKSATMQGDISEIDSQVVEMDSILQKGVDNTTKIQQQLNATHIIIDQFIEINNQTLNEALFYTLYLKENRGLLDQELTSLENNITLAKSTIAEQKQSCLEKKEEFEILLETCPNEDQCTIMEETLIFLDECIEKADEAQSGLNEVAIEVNNTKNTLTTLDNNINETEESLNERVKTIALFVDYSNITIESMKSSLKEFQTDLNNSLDVKANVVEKIANVETVLGDTKEKADSLKTQLTNLGNKTKEFANITAEGLVEPILPKIKKTISGKQKVVFFFPYLIILVVMLVCTFSSITMVFAEKESRASIRSFTSPTKASLFVLSTYITVLTIAILQILLILVVGKALFNVPIFNNLPFVLVGSLLASTIFIFLGMLIGYTFDNIEVSMVLGVCASAIFLLISPLSYPMEGLSPFIIPLVPFNPFVLSTEAIRKFMILNKMTKFELYLLSGYAVYLWLVLDRIYKRIRTRKFD